MSERQGPTDGGDEVVEVPGPKPKPRPVPPPGGKVISIIDRQKDTAKRYVGTIGDLLAGDWSVDFLLPGCLPIATVGLITGESGAKKTWIAYEACRAVATGTPFMNRGLPARQGGVLILNFDNPTNVLADRVKLMGFTADLPVHIHTLGFTNPANGMPALLRMPGQYSRLKHLVDEFQPSLIIVDSMRQSHTEDENDNKAMSMLMSTFKSWTAVNNASVLIVHHTAKSNNADWVGKARGSGEIFASAGVEIYVADDTLRWTKHQAWDVGDVDQCTFKLESSFLGDCDEVNDEDVRKLLMVKATSALPLEIELIFEAKILGALRSKPNYGLSLKELSAECKLPMPRVKEFLYDARRLGKIRSKSVQRVRHYFANDPVQINEVNDEIDTE